MSLINPHNHNQFEHNNGKHVWFSENIVEMTQHK